MFDMPTPRELAACVNDVSALREDPDLVAILGGVGAKFVNALVAAGASRRAAERQVADALVIVAKRDGLADAMRRGKVAA